MQKQRKGRKLTSSKETSENSSRIKQGPGASVRDQHDKMMLITSCAAGTPQVDGGDHMLTTSVEPPDWLEAEG